MMDQEPGRRSSPLVRKGERNEFDIMNGVQYAKKNFILKAINIRNILLFVLVVTRRDIDLKLTFIRTKNAFWPPFIRTGRIET